MRDDAWINALRSKMTTTIQLQEFVALWIRLQDVNLQSKMQVTITWRWTADGQYSTRSTYHIQFKGFYIKYNSNLIWKAHTENTCKLFTWILIQDKILTADNLNLRGWPHQKWTARDRSPPVPTLPLCPSGLATSCNLGPGNIAMLCYPPNQVNA
jgi:hypothetical protein